MNHCKNYLLTLAENIILKTRIDQLEKAHMKSAYDFSALHNYKIGNIILSGQLTVQHIQFSSNPIQSALSKFNDEPYETIVNASIEGLAFPAVKTDLEEPQLLACSSKWHHEMLGIAIHDMENALTTITFYGIEWPQEEPPAIKNFPATEGNMGTYVLLLNTVIENSLNSIFILNPERLLMKLNTTGRDLLETYHKMLPQPGELFDPYIDARQRPRYLQRFRDALNGTQGTDEVVLRTPEGKQEWFDYHYFPVLNADQYVSYVLVTFRNKTRTRILERKYYETKLRADESERLKKAFLNSMSHEIRTPMNGIMGFADLINRPSLPEEKKQKYASLIKDNSQHLMYAFEEIMDIARIESGEMTVNEVCFDLNKLFDDLFFYCKNHFFTGWHSNVTLYCRKEREAETVSVSADRGKIKQIILNLLSNSFKSTSVGYIEFGYYFDQDGHLNIYTSDSGKGITSKPQKILYDHPGHSGYISQQSVDEMKSGMGLSIVKGYVGFLNGHLQMHSQPGIGSMFKAQLPLSENNQCYTKPVEKQSHAIHAYYSQQYAALMQPLLGVLSDSKIFKYTDPDTYNFDDHQPVPKIIFFHAGQPMSSVKYLVDTLTPKDHTFIYLTDHVSKEEKEICYSYGIHEYLPYQTDPDYVAFLLRKYLF